MSNILDRRRTHFVLWCPTEPANAPALVIGRIRNGNPATFQELARQTLQRANNAAGPITGLWHLAASSLGLTDGQTYHYWFEVDNTYPGSTGRIQVTDPLASGVDYRLLAPANPSVVHPASVIGCLDAPMAIEPCGSSFNVPAIHLPSPTSCARTSRS